MTSELVCALLAATHHRASKAPNVGLDANLVLPIHLLRSPGSVDTGGMAWGARLRVSGGQRERGNLSSEPWAHTEPRVLTTYIPSPLPPLT